jgi:hypothetical protein
VVVLVVVEVVVAGAGGAGASAGFTTSLVVVVVVVSVFALQPTAMVAKLITITSASKRKIHFFMRLHLLSVWDGTLFLFYPPIFFRTSISTMPPF